MSMFDYRMIIEGQSNNNEAGKRGWLFGAGVAAVRVVALEACGELGGFEAGQTADGSLEPPEKQMAGA